MKALLEHPRVLKLMIVLLFLLLAVPASGQEQKSETAPREAGRGPLRIPSRPRAPLFQSTQGKQKTEIQFDPATRIVTLHLLVQDENGFFIPNLRRENFAVYEDGVRQQVISTDIEHPPASIGLLIEFGGQTPSVNHELGEEVSRAAQQLVEELDHDDRVAVWKYSDKVEKVVDFSATRDSLTTLLYRLGTPDISETNLYDAIISLIGEMRPVTGRKAIVLISSGVDTASKARYQDALNAAGNSDSPIYVLGLTKVLQNYEDVYGHPPVARTQWEKAQRELQEFARVSKGRAYIPENTVNLSSVYDDMLENIKVRYIIRYRSSDDSNLNSPRRIRVELVDPSTGGPLQIVDSNGKSVRSRIVIQDSYIPAATSSR
jgi:VWFA-related protein